MYPSVLPPQLALCVERRRTGANHIEIYFPVPHWKQNTELKSLGGKKFRSVAQAEIHGSRTEHVNFSESTEEIAPLTEEQKKEKLAELRHKAAEKKSAQSEEDKLANKRNEVSAE